MSQESVKSNKISEEKVWLKYFGEKVKEKIFNEQLLPALY